jgi:hypothetical protein
MSANDVMQKYLRQIGQLPGTVNAPELAGGKKRVASPLDSNFLHELLSQQSVVNRRMLAVAVSLVCVTFAITVYLALRTPDSAAAVKAMGVGSGAEVCWVTWLRSLWRDSNLYSILLVAAERLSPDELAKLVGGLYFKPKDSAKKSRVAAPAA